jgi:acyl-CoA synthetase (AMP-forming)/AMP-acid ligase II
MRNCPSWILSYMAIAKAGGVATLLNGWWQPEEFKQALALSEPALILADEQRAARLQAGGCTVPLMAIPVDQPAETALAELLGVGEGADLPDATPDDHATILFTSGSTGVARGAVSTHRAVVNGVYVFAMGLMTLKAIMESEGRPPPNPPKTLLNVPLFHVTGEVPVMLNSFVIGRGMVLMPKWDAGEALRLIEKEKITYFIGVPTMSLELMTHPDRQQYDISTLTDLAAGGAPRPVSHVERLRENMQAQPAIGYGLTETNAVGCMNFWSNYADKPASTGRPLRPFVEVAILAEDGRHCAPGEQGEIAIRSSANVEGYWRDEVATRATFTDNGYMRTGDVGYLDEDHYLFIVDRKKEIIIRGGENISTAEVEAACYACPAVAEVAVFGAPDERLGEVPVAVLHCREPVTEDELRAFLADKIAAYKIPQRMVFSDDSLPRLGTGKIDRVSLKAKYAA